MCPAEMLVLLIKHVDPSVQIDDVISQAQTTRAALGSQRALFGDVQGKVKQLGDRFPVIRGLIGTTILGPYLLRNCLG